MVISGAKHRAQSYIEGLDMLASMRLCANVPSQHAIQTALGGYQSIGDLVLPTGRLGRQRDLAWEMLDSIPGVSCVKPKSALYLFPKLDPKVFPFEDDEAFALDLLREEKVLIVQGTAFNWPDPDHFRVVFLPRPDDLEDSIGRIARYLDRARKKIKTARRSVAGNAMYCVKSSKLKVQKRGTGSSFSYRACDSITVSSESQTLSKNHSFCLAFQL